MPKSLTTPLTTYPFQFCTLVTTISHVAQLRFGRWPSSKFQNTSTKTIRRQDLLPSADKIAGGSSELGPLKRAWNLKITLTGQLINASPVVLSAEGNRPFRRNVFKCFYFSKHWRGVGAIKLKKLSSDTIVFLLYEVSANYYNIYIHIS